MPVERLRDERGMAIVVVMLVMLVLTSFSIAVVQLSLHSTTAARYDERYYQAFQAAEQGLADYLAVLPTTSNQGSTESTGLCALNGVSRDADIGPPTTRYVLTISLYNAAGTKLGCTGPNYTGLRPTQALITSRGSAGSTQAGFVTRSMQEKVNLDAIYGAGVNKALYGGRNVVISNNVDVDYFDQTNDADIYSGGDVTVNNYLDLQGSIYAQGNVTFKGCIEGNIYAKGSVTGGASYIGGCNSAPQPGVDAESGVNLYPGFGYVTSSTSFISLAPGAWAYGSCTTKTGQSDTHTYCSNQKKPSKPNTPAQCGDAVANMTEPCGVKLATVPDPPTINFPKLAYSAANWTALGYKIHTYANCANAISDFQDYLSGVTPTRQTSGDAWTAANVASGDHVFDVTADCAFVPASSTGYTLKGNVAVMMRGATTASIDFGPLAIASAGGNTHTLFLETPWSAVFSGVDPTWTNTASIATKCGVPNNPQLTTNATQTLNVYNHRYGTKNNMETIRLFDYTPCDILTYNQNKSGVGQYMAGETLYVNNSFSLGYFPIDNPDVAPSGFTPQPIFTREIQS